MPRDPYVEVGPLLLFPERMRNIDHVAGIGVRRLERRSSFPIPTPPPLGSRDIYDYLNVVQDLKNIKNVKGCRDRMPKTRQTR